MAALIFYYSITGNSLFTARKISENLEGSDLIPIPLVPGSSIDIRSEVAGLIFPVYAWGLPGIVEDFAKKLKIDKGCYIFAVATSGATPAGVLQRLKKILKKKGHDLNSGFLVREDFRNADTGRASVVNLWNLSGINPVSLTERLSEITDIIIKRQNHRTETSSALSIFLGNLLHGIAIKRYKNTDFKFTVDENCNLCGICRRICPRDNIMITSGKLSWKKMHNCESCYGCYNWCPMRAIHLNNGQDIIPGYHNPAVGLEDIMLR
ncbi:MAG: EFR1 family ferrodoxin [Brevinematales bacterium]